MTDTLHAPRPGDAPTHLAVAARELRAAQAIVLDPSCEDALAATHLATAWEALALATCPEGQPPDVNNTWPKRQTVAAADANGTGPEGQAPGAEPDANVTCPEGQTAPTPLPGPLTLGPVPGDRAALPTELAAAIDPVLPALLAARGRSPFEPLPWTVPHAVLERHLDALAWLLARHQAPRPAPQLLSGLRPLVLGAALLGLFVIALRPWQRESVGPWAATYFNRADLSGTAIHRRDLELRFDWGEKSPMDALPADRFSVRWDTCLDVSAAVSVPFQLISDDGSRLFLDDRLVLDNWGKHELAARGATLTLAPGEHHLRVEYVEHTGAAQVALFASFDGEPPKAIPGSMLRAPDDDGESPCGDGSP